MPQSSPRSPIVSFGTRDDAVHQRSPASRGVSDDCMNRARDSGSPNIARARGAFRPDDNTLDRTRGLGGKNKVNFGGLQGVPTGPKRDRSSQCPCICISSRNIPNPQSLTRHLNGMLKSLRPDKQLVDESGWYIFYDDSPAGHDKLRRCYENFHRKKLFNQYELYMECFPDGKPPPPRQRQDSRSSGGHNESNSLSSPRQHTYKTVLPKNFDFKASRQITNPEPEPEPTRHSEIANGVVLSTSGDSNVPVQKLSHSIPRDVSDHSTEGLRVHEPTLTGSHTALLSLRSDRDETASLASGATRSDSSRARANKCHRCDGDTAPGSPALVRCSTCHREYHRRCHQDPVIPANLTDDHNWICARCVKKGRTGKEASKRDTLKLASMINSSATKTDVLFEVVSARGQRELPHSHAPIQKKLDPVTRLQVEALRSGSKSPQNEVESAVDTTSNIHMRVFGGESLLSDADHLVAKSFAAAEDQTHVRPHSHDAGKLKFTRIKLPPKMPSAATEHPLNEDGNVQDSVTTPTIKPTNGPQTNEAVARNSVTDLRALAHGRHQTAIKSGNESHFDREDQPHRQIAAIDSVKSSSAQQPSNERRAPQQPEKSLSSFTAFGVAEHTIEWEIPESLDEVRRDVQTSETMKSNPRSLPKVDGADTRLSAERTAEANPLHPRKPPGLKGPRAPSVAQCGRCRKAIPQGPSGKNKLCSGCKKEVVTRKEVEGVMEAKSAPSISAPPVQRAFAPVARTSTGPQMNYDQADLSAHTPGPAVAHGQQEAAPQTSKDQAPINGNSVEPPTNTGHSGGSTAKTTNANVDGDSTMQAAMTSGPAEDETFHNPVAARILGELQFLLAVQMQLREDPFMSEFKLHQLKRILAENETARTDEKVLKEQLNAALMSIDSLPSPDRAGNTLDSASNNSTDSVEAEDPDMPQSKLDFIKSIVGDSSQRPKGSRLILVAMALGSTAARRMQARDVMEWVDSTIPTYKKGEGNWASRISAMLSQGRMTESGRGYWQEEEWQESDIGKPGHRWYRLLPEKEDEMWTWCPVLKEPISPQSRRDARARKAVGGLTAKTSVQHAPASSNASTVTPKSAPITPIPSADNSLNIYCGSFIMGDDGKPVNTAAAETAEDDPMDIEERTPEGGPKPFFGRKRKRQPSVVSSTLFTPGNKEFSSDDEPLSARVKRMRAETLPQDRARRLRMVRAHSLMNTETGDQSDLEHNETASKSTEHENVVNDVPDDPNEAPSSSVDQTRPGLVTLKFKGGRKPPTAENPDRHVPTDQSQLAPSLYEEWPEYRQPTFDEHDKLAEIRARPRKKQLFGELAPYLHKTPLDFTAITSPEKRSRKMVDPTATDPYFWENPDIDPTRQEYDSLEDFFDFPRNVVPIVSEGQLAYRDGTKGADGGLPRAREIFKP
jgi:hypothetical protein